MSIQSIFHNHMISARKCGAKEEVEIFSFLCGELSRINDGKEISDEQAIKVLKKIKKSLEESIQLKSKSDEKDYILLFILNEFIPKEISENEIKAFISTFDFSPFKNRMQAMGTIMKHFGSNVDGNVVKKILMEN